MPSKFSDSPLDNIQIAAPCRASWEHMRGDDTVRFCQTCRKNVYNISMMSRAEAEALIEAKEGNLCVRFAQRADGTVVTDDCPVGLRAIRRSLVQGLAAGAAATVAFGCALIGIGGKSSAQPFDLRHVQPFKLVYDWINPAPISPPIPILPPVSIIPSEVTVTMGLYPALPRRTRGAQAPSGSQLSPPPDFGAAQVSNKP